MNKPLAKFKVQRSNDIFILILDLNSGQTITDNASDVICRLNQDIDTGLKRRKVYYRDTSGQYDQLDHDNGTFKRILPCTQSQQSFLSAFTTNIPSK